LPSEEQWELATRGGTSTARYGILDAIAWYAGNSGRSRIDSNAIWKADPMNYARRLFENGNGPKPVGRKQPNAFGLYDMLGNAWQWTTDENSKGERAERGGAWNSNPESVRVSYRVFTKPDTHDNITGLRCVGPN
jgi:sulfatase modifying factor 1